MPFTQMFGFRFQNYVNDEVVKVITIVFGSQDTQPNYPPSLSTCLASTGLLLLNQVLQTCANAIFWNQFLMSGNIEKKPFIRSVSCPVKMI